MTTSLVDDTVTPLAELLLACLAESVALLEHAPRNVQLRPGGPVEALISTSRDECCEGLAWVRLVDDYPSTAFPLEDGEANPCPDSRVALVFELGVVRCAPTPDEHGIPSAEQWATLAKDVFADRAAVLRAICCFSSLDEDRSYVIGHWLPLPVEGGCVGGVRTVTVAAVDCVVCDDEATSIGATVSPGTVNAVTG